MNQRCPLGHELMLTRESLKYPNLPSPNKRELSKEGFSHLTVLSSKEVGLALSILQRHLSKSVNLGRDVHILCPEFASSPIGQIIRRDKALRILAPEFSEEFMRLDGIRSLRTYFEGFDLANVTYNQLVIENREEVYFRVVRPKEASDVGSFHRDQWFNEIYTPENAHLSSFKVWIALNCPPGSGLKFVLRSEDREWPYEVVSTPNGPRPKGAVPNSEPSIQPRISAGEAFIFDPFTLHKGAINPGPENRVSVELCFTENNRLVSKKRAGSEVTPSLST